MSKPPNLSPVDAYEAIQRLLAEGDTVGLTRHARDQCAERNVTLDDIRNVLIKGTVSPRAEWNETSENWKYSVSGVDCERDPLTLIIVLEPWICRITIVTVMGK